LIIITIGKIKAISTSKIRKIIAIIKNRIEKGRREELDGSNPHSKGDLFSRSIKAFFDKRDANNITIIEINKTIYAIIITEKIIYTKYLFSPFDWKSNILLYYINLSTSSVNRNI
jgi:hypothetical protein